LIKNQNKFRDLARKKNLTKNDLQDFSEYEIKGITSQNILRNTINLKDIKI